MAAMPNDFHARAAKAASAAASSGLSPGELLAQSLTNDRPTIDAAVKSFMSLCAARSITVADTDMGSAATAASGETASSPKCFFPNEADPRKASLLCARSLLGAVNSLVLPEGEHPSGEVETAEEKTGDAAEAWEREVVRVLWNGLIKSGKKPSRFLGRQALSYAYPLVLERVRSGATPEDGSAGLLPGGVDEACAMAFFEEFGSLLVRPVGKGSDGVDEKDDDGALLWDTDGGASELQRRRERRAKRGAEAARQHAEAKEKISSLTIEELSNDEDAESGNKEESGDQSQSR